MLSSVKRALAAVQVVKAQKRRNSLMARFYATTDSSSEQQGSKLHKGVVRDLRRGNLWEYAQMKKHPDGKIWPGREVLAEQNKMWPSDLLQMRGQGLVKKDEVDLETHFTGNPASFVLVSQKRPFAVNQIESWTTPIRERHPSIPIVDITITHNLGYWWLNPVLASIWKSNDRVNSIFAYSYASPLSHLTDDGLGIDVENGFLSYQFLVDSDLKLRWLSVGTSNDNELDRVSASIRRLTAEFNTKPSFRPARKANSVLQALNERSKSSQDSL